MGRRGPKPGTRPPVTTWAPQDDVAAYAARYADRILERAGLTREERDERAPLLALVLAHRFHVCPKCRAWYPRPDRASGRRSKGYCSPCESARKHGPALDPDPRNPAGGRLPPLEAIP